MLSRVAIVVLNYNGGRCLAACLQSLEHLDYGAKDIIVIDNGSVDESFADARKHFPQYIYLRNEENEGFAKGMNKGMRVALERGAEWVWLFNNDAVTSPETLTHLLSVARVHPRAGLLSPIIVDSKTHQTWFAQGRVNFFRMRTEHLLPTKQALSQESYPSEFLTGCAMLIRKDVAETIGFLDERFFLYYEDADYSLRATQAGFLCLVVSKARVFHAEASNQRSEKVYHLVYSGLLFFAKHDPLLLRLYHAVYVVLRRVKNFFDRARGKERASWAHQAYRKYFYGS